jgi:hypothetical protein
VKVYSRPCGIFFWSRLPKFSPSNFIANHRFCYARDRLYPALPLQGGASPPLKYLLTLLANVNAPTFLHQISGWL